MSDRKEAIIRIELLSDLCVGSGYSYAGIVDSDVCCDQYGIPYIPAKRLRGCLRETLESCLYTIYPEKAEQFFGEAGANKVSDFTIGNARIENYDALRDEICTKRSHENGSFYGTQEILERFTHVLGQTAIDANGTAKANSLRYTRAINQYSPLTEERKQLVFEAPVTYLMKDKEMLENIVKGTRHIGLKRNRGLGWVQCELKDIKNDNSTGKNAEDDEKPANETGRSHVLQTQNVCGEQRAAAQTGNRSRLRVRIRNMDPLVLSSLSENESERYLSGQAMLGALAGRYVEIKGDPGKKKAEEKEDEWEKRKAEFNDLFLNGETIFSNLYPCDRDRIYYPAPVYINRLKKTKKLVNVLQKNLPTDCADQDYNPGDGNQPKKLKGQFVSLLGTKASVSEVEREIVYHHSLHKKNVQGKDGILYDLEVITANQTFEGFIEGEDSRVMVLKELIEKGDLYLGKSKTSQYGRCSVSCEKMETGEAERIVFHRGQQIVVTFLSDAILLSKKGEYTVYLDEIREIVREELHIPADLVEPQDGADQECYLSNVQTTMATGYLSVWNLRRSAAPAIQAGSCLVYRLSGDYCPSSEFIGERNLEGYGQIRIDCAKEMSYSGLTEEKQEGAASIDNPPTGASGELKNLMQEPLLNRWMEAAAFSYLSSGAARSRITNSALSRITMMLRESLEENRDNPQGALDEFAKRVNSIKSTSVKKEGQQILQMVAVKENSKWSINLAHQTKNASTEQNVLKEMESLGYSQGEVEGMINARWGSYLMVVLTVQKYLGGDR